MNGFKSTEVKALSKEHARNLIRKLYKDEGFENSTSLPGEIVDKEFSVDIDRSKFASLFCFLDEIISIYNTFVGFTIGSIVELGNEAAFQYRFPI